MGTISTAGAYGMAKLGIYAAQKAMEVTGNNITNINTEGYTRQRLDQKSLYMAGADRYSTKWEARVGGGVITTGVSQLRDPYLDIRYRTEMSSVGAYETRLKGLNQLAGILDEVGKGEDDEGVFEAQFNDLIAQLTDMAASGAGKDEFDTLVQGSAKALVSLFNTYGGKLETIRQNTETGFKQDIDTVNTILKKIQNLNDSIRKSDIHGGPGLELRDERNLLLDQLSEYVAIDVRYEMEPVGAGLMVEKLIVELDSHERLDANGQSLGHDKQQLVNGEYVTQFNVHMESENPPKYGPNYDIQMTELRNPVNLVYEKDGNQSEAVWLTDNDLYGRLQATRELLTEKGEFATNEDINGKDPDQPPYVQAKDDKGDLDANIKRGIPYYQKALDLMAKKFADSLNEANMLPDSSLYMVQTNADGEPIDTANRALVAQCINGEFKYYVKDDYNKNPPVLTESAPVFVDKDGKALADQTDKTQYVQNPLYSYYNGGPLFSNNGNTNDTDGITATNISISNGWATGAVHVLQTKQEIDPSRPQSTLQDNIQHILSIVADNDLHYRPSDLYPNEPNASPTWDTSFFTGSYQDFLTEICSTLADDSRVTSGRMNNYVSAVNDLYGDRDSVSGVDLNDEAIAMMQYNKAYSASCRLLTTLDEMIDKLVNGTAI